MLSSGFFYLCDEMEKIKSLWLLRPEGMLFFWGLVFGVVFLVLQPIGRAPDEYRHFARSYELAHGQWFNAHKTIPQSITAFDNEHFRYKDRQYLKNIPLNLSEKVPNTNDLYDMPLAYSPQMFAFGLGMLLKLPPFWIYYLGRILVLCAWLLMCQFIYKIALDFLRPFLFLFLLLPINIQQATSFSCDALNLAFCLLFVLYVLYLCQIPKNIVISLWEMGNLLVLALLLSFAKPIFCLLIPFILFVPAKHFGGGLQKTIFAIIVFSTAFWTQIAWQSNVPYLHANALDWDINPMAQIDFILQKPFHFLKTLWLSLYNNVDEYLLEIVGQKLAWGDLHINKSASFLVLLWLVFLGIASTAKERYAPSFWQRIFLLLSFTLFTIILFTGLYINFTPVAHGIVWGFQARYILPVFLLLVMALRGNNIQNHFKIYTQIGVSMLLLVFLYTFVFYKLYLYGKGII